MGRFSGPSRPPAPLILCGGKWTRSQPPTFQARAREPPRNGSPICNATLHVREPSLREKRANHTSRWGGLTWLRLGVVVCVLPLSGAVSGVQILTPTPPPLHWQEQETRLRAVVLHAEDDVAELASHQPRFHVKGGALRLGSRTRACPHFSP
jgi:hypothetical protein